MMTPQQAMIAAACIDALGANQVVLAFVQLLDNHAAQPPKNTITDENGNPLTDENGNPITSP